MMEKDLTMDFKNEHELIMEYKGFHYDSIEELNVLQLMTSHGYLQVHKVWLKRLGALKAVVLCNYLEKHIYFKERYPEMDGWFYLLLEQMTEELGESKRTLQRIKAELVRDEFLFRGKLGFPAKEVVKVNFRKIQEFLLPEIHPTPNFPPETRKNVSLGEPLQTQQHIRKTQDLKKVEPPLQDVSLEARKCVSLEARKCVSLTLINKNKYNNKKNKKNITKKTKKFEHENLGDNFENNQINTSIRQNEKSPKDLKKEKLNQKFITFSTQLYDFISQTKNINLPKSRIFNWVRDFDLLYRIDGISISRQQKALNWYFSHAYQEFVPIIESGGAFRKKFISLENAMNRASNSGKRTSYTPQKSIGIAHLPKETSLQNEVQDDITTDENGNFIALTERGREVLKSFNQNAF